jgi:hypothetical protein
MGNDPWDFGLDWPIFTWYKFVLIGNGMFPDQNPQEGEA